MSPESALAAYKQQVETELKRYLDAKIAEASQVSPSAEAISRHIAEFTLRGGKRFRSALFYYGYRLFGGKDEEEAVKTSIFIELIQSYLLMHDDIMDRSPLRRGGPTMHVIYQEFSRQHGFHDDLHFGQAIATLAGDIASQYALEIISQAAFPAEDKVRLLELVAREVNTVCIGQLHDILLGYGYPSAYEEKDILAVYSQKTATYTFRLPLLGGAMLAGASGQDLSALETYAMESGIAYQIRDDILGVFGSNDETGKDTKSDLAEGKKTLLVSYAYAQSDETQKAVLDRLLGKKDLSEAEANDIRRILQDTGAPEYCTRICERKTQAARQALDGLMAQNPEALEFLEGITDYLLVRPMKRDGLHPVLAEIIFGGHLASLGLSSIGLTLFLLEGKPVKFVPLVATYLISQTVYSYNHCRELDHDLKSNPERSQHLQAAIAWTQASPWCYSLLLLVCLSLTNVPLFLLGILLVAGGILYTDYLKEPATKKIPGFKNLYTSLFLALSVFIVPLYLSGRISPVYLYLSLFLFFRMGINTIFCDIKDIQSDAKRDIKTLPVLFGKAPSLALLEIANLVSLAALLGAVHAGILPQPSLALAISVAYDLVYLTLAFWWDGQKLRSLTYVMADFEFWIWPLAVLALRVVR